MDLQRLSLWISMPWWLVAVLLAAAVAGSLLVWGQDLHWAWIAGAFPESVVGEIRLIGVVLLNLGVAQLSIGLIQNPLRTVSGIERKFEPLPVTLGSLESVVYLAAWVIAREQFIALWLAIKVVAGWRTEGRKHYSMTLISMLLNVLFATAAFGLMRAEGIIN